jgi:hypothetical protein
MPTILWHGSADINTARSRAANGIRELRHLKQQTSSGMVVLVSLVSVLGENWPQTAEIGELVETGEIVEIANIHAIFMHVAEKMVG